MLVFGRDFLFLPVHYAPAVSMDVSIIIINYRTPNLIVNCLQSVFQNTSGVELEIIIVDNDPENGGKAQILEVYPSVTYIDMEYNAGFGRSNNRGMQIAKGRYLLLLNADTLLPDNVIGRFVAIMDERKDVVASAAMQYDADMHPMNFYKSFNEFRRTFFILPPGGALERFVASRYPEPKYSDPDQYDWLVGAFFFVRKEAFEATKGFDEDFFMYGEDTEWSGRLAKLGKLCYFKNQKFIHLENNNPFRRTNISWINRFSAQMQISNLLWVRKQYGALSYIMLVTHYITMIPVVYAWKMLFNLKKDGQPFSELRTQYIYTRKVAVLLKYFWRTLTLQKGLYKIKPSENIDLLTQK